MSEIESNGLAMEFILKALPYPNQIKDIEMHSDCIYFTWRSGRYKLELHGSVMRSENGMLLGDDASILINRLIEIEQFKHYVSK